MLKGYELGNNLGDLNTGMSITIDLSPETEARLAAKAARQGEDAATVAARVLAEALEWELQADEEAFEGIQQGVDDAIAGRHRPIGEFIAEQRLKHALRPAP